MRNMVALCLLALATAASACPTMLNLVPTADVVGRGGYSLGLELDGHATPFSEGAELWAMTDFGVTDRLEVGVDVADATSRASWFVDAKWQVVPEAHGAPAVAVGVLDMVHLRDEGAWYAVASKNVPGSPLRLTAGFQRDDRSRGLLGGQYAVNDAVTLYADWTTGPETYATLGVGRSLTDGVSVLAYYARSNTSREDDFVGLNLCFSGHWR